MGKILLTFCLILTSIMLTSCGGTQTPDTQTGSLSQNPISSGNTNTLPPKSDTPISTPERPTPQASQGNFYDASGNLIPALSPEKQREVESDLSRKVEY